MKRKHLEERLDRKLKRESTLLASAGVLSLLFSFVIVWLTFWSIYGILLFTTWWWVSLSHLLLTSISAGIVVLLFIGNATTDRSYLNKIELNLGPNRDLKVAVAVASGYGWTLAFWDAKATRSTIKMLTTLLYTGPRMVVASWNMLHRAVRMRKIKALDVSDAIATAIKKESRVPLTDLLVDLHMSQQVRLVESLLLIDGVVLLRSDPPGITLSPELTKELLTK